jgi:hypothetical protein
VGEETVVKVKETAVSGLVVAALLSVTVLVEVDTATTVVPDAIPVPDTVLPTTIDEAEVTDVTVVLPEIRVPVEVVTTPEVV